MAVDLGFVAILHRPGSGKRWPEPGMDQHVSEVRAPPVGCDHLHRHSQRKNKNKKSKSRRERSCRMPAVMLECW